MEEVYPGDLHFLGEQIKRRHIEDHLIHLRIVNQPHLEEEQQKEFVEELMGQHKTVVPEDPDPQLDREGLAELKDYLRHNSRLVKVK